jgi:hypothetical protein
MDGFLSHGLPSPAQGDWRIDGGKIPLSVITGVPGAQIAYNSEISIKIRSLLRL